MNDDFFQALASPYRREIIKLLKWQNLTAGEIAAKFDISQPSISRHLDILKRAEIIVAEKRANQIIYSLNLSVLQELMVGIIGLLNVKGSDEDAEGNN
ncbi:autorepressor SdpR family transcription factor [Pseudostreptobacillus hongkongensis]|uniref:autorepressor SdpR family transcription factor n=1 Tax=Pseudostreptobacillus hongkongensis TaxID=1162717 RepID=UPI0028D37966|nr:autorepressor SdpR family transcription factor [Pseudostreptobacillus hongkongensis]